MSSTNQPGDTVNQLGPKAPGSPHADDHDTSGPPSPEVIARGYEADVYDSRTVFSVPLLVILFFVLAFGTVTVIFSLIAYPRSVNDKAHPGLANRNKAPLNERLAKIDRGTKSEDGVKQPRLEPLRQRSGEDLARAITRPELPTGNSPEIHPEELRPTPENFPSLFGSGQGKVGIDKTMSLNNDTLKALFPVQPNGTKPANSQHVPTASNAGRGAEGSQVIVPELPKQAEDKKAEPKKDEKKDNPAPKPPPAPEPKPKGGM
jgi:hypothetical protein